MEDSVLKAYEYLTPAEQLGIDLVILALYRKDMEIRNLVKEITDSLGEK